MKIQLKRRCTGLCKCCEEKNRILNIMVNFEDENCKDGCVIKSEKVERLFNKIRGIVNE